MKQEICRATTGEALLQGMPLFCVPLMPFWVISALAQLHIAMPEPTITECSIPALIKVQIHGLMNY